MRAQLRAWWGLRTTREQRMLLAMAALLALTVAWLGIVRPLDDGLAGERARHARAVIDLAAARGQADRIGLLEKDAAPASSTPLPALLGGRLNEAGFAGGRVTPDGAGRVTIAIDAARAQALFGFIADLERRDGLVVDRLTARANSDATLAAEATVRRRRR